MSSKRKLTSKARKHPDGPHSQKRTSKRVAKGRFDIDKLMAWLVANFAPPPPLRRRRREAV